MYLIKKIIRKIAFIYHKSSSEKYINFFRKKGVKIGKGTIILDPYNIQIDYSRPELLEIGENVFLHKGTIIMTHDWASWCFVNKYQDFIPSHAKVKIGNNVWLGENTAILKGVEIGNNVIIGFGSIVTKSIPSNSVAIGAPAKVICSLDDYYKKRKEQYQNECFEYAKSIFELGREPQIEDFYDDYPLFVNKENFQKYKYPYYNVFNKEQFNIWKDQHKSTYKGFEEFINAVKEKYGIS